MKTGNKMGDILRRIHYKAKEKKRESEHVSIEGEGKEEGEDARSAPVGARRVSCDKAGEEGRSREVSLRHGRS